MSRSTLLRGASICALAMSTFSSSVFAQSMLPTIEIGKQQKTVARTARAG